MLQRRCHLAILLAGSLGGALPSAMAQAPGVPAAALLGQVRGCRRGLAYLNLTIGRFGAIGAPPGADARADLSGTVSDIHGRPMSGARVYVYTAGPRVGTSSFCPSCWADCGKQADADASGRFHFHALSASLVFRLLVVKAGYAPTFARHVDPLRGPVKITIDRYVPASDDPARQAVGQVVDQSGRPVAGAEVEPQGIRTGDSTTFGTIEGVEPMAITDEHGLFRFVCPRAGQSLVVHVEARGLAPCIVQNLRTGGRAPQRIALAEGTTITGTVRDAAGRGLASVTVQIVPVDRNCETFVGKFEIGTEKDGVFRLPNVPARREYLVFPRMDSLLDNDLGADRQTFTAGENGATTDPIRVVVKPSARASGKVTLSDGSAIPAGTRIMLSRSGTWDQQQMLLGQDGGFSFRGIPRDEDMEISINVPGHHYAENTPGYDARFRTVRLRIYDKTSASRIAVMLAPDVTHKPIRVRVVGPDGKACANAEVYCTYGAASPEARNPFLSGGARNPARTDGQGIAQITPPVESGDIRARCGELGTEKAVNAQAGEETVVRLQARALAALSGKVTDEAGRPIRGATVMLFAMQSERGPGAGTNTKTTDAGGRYRFTGIFADYQYVLSAEASGYGRAGISVAQCKPGGDAAMQQMRLERADSALAGRVVDRKGRPLAGQIVWMYGWKSRSQQTTTDDTGRFRFEGLVKETVNVNVQTLGAAPTQPTRVQAGDTNVVIEQPWP